MSLFFPSERHLQRMHSEQRRHREKVPAEPPRQHDVQSERANVQAGLLRWSFLILSAAVSCRCTQQVHWHVCVSECAVVYSFQAKLGNICRQTSHGTLILLLFRSSVLQHWLKPTSGPRTCGGSDACWCETQGPRISYQLLHQLLEMLKAAWREALHLTAALGMLILWHQTCAYISRQHSFRSY